MEVAKKLIAKHYFSLLRMSVNTCENEKRQNLNFIYTLHHTVLSKTTLACTILLTHIFILMNLHQSVTK